MRERRDVGIPVDGKACGTDIPPRVLSCLHAAAAQDRRGAERHLKHRIGLGNEIIASYLEDYFTLLGRITTGPYPPDTNMARNILNNLLYIVNRIYTRLQLGSDRARNRKEEICHRLVQLIFEHYAHERRAQFYADKMGLSLQHLSTTVKQVTGRNILDLIAHVVMVDVKAKLKSTNMTIQEIAYSLNFPNASFFGKYFKRHMGMTPQEYRNS